MFTFKKPSFLGIDFGMSHIKAVECVIKNDKPYLTNYGEVLVDFSDLKDSASQSQTPEDKVTALLALLLRKMAPKSKNAYVSMPGFSGLITLIELPKMSREELEKAVQFEAQRHIPSPLSEVVLSWDVVSKQVIRDDTPIQKVQAVEMPSSVEVLLVAALHKEVEKYERYIAENSLKMEMLELETFSLVRSLASDDGKTFLIIDIGSRSTNLILVEDGFINVNRNVSAGGHEITTTLSEALNITWERADIMKAGDKDFLNNKESTIIFPSLELVINEARRIIAAYKEKHAGSSIDHVILSGGASKMKGLDAYLAKALDLQVSIGDPWEKISYDERLKDSVKGLGASYSVAIGLVLAGIESYDRS